MQTTEEDQEKRIEGLTAVELMKECVRIATS